MNSWLAGALVGAAVYGCTMAEARGLARRAPRLARAPRRGSALLSAVTRASLSLDRRTAEVHAWAIARGAIAVVLACLAAMSLETLRIEAESGAEVTREEVNTGVIALARPAWIGYERAVPGSLVEARPLQGKRGGIRESWTRRSRVYDVWYHAHPTPEAAARALRGSLAADPGAVRTAIGENEGVDYRADRAGTRAYVEAGSVWVLIEVRPAVESTGLASLVRALAGRLRSLRP